MTITVIKRDGSKEKFHPEKIIRVLLAAGLEEESALTVASNVASNVASLNSPEITSIQIRDMVIKELNQVDPYISGLYSWYQQSKDQMYQHSTAPSRPKT